MPATDTGSLVGDVNSFLTHLAALLTTARWASVVPPKADIAQMISALIGPQYYRRWFTREPMDAAFIQGIVDNVLGTAQS